MKKPESGRPKTFVEGFAPWIISAIVSSQVKVARPPAEHPLTTKVSVN